MKKYTFLLLLFCPLLIACDPFGENDPYRYQRQDIFSIENETGLDVCVEIQARYPMPGPGCDFIQINKKYSDICNVFKVYTDAHIGYATAISMNLSHGRYDSIISVVLDHSDVVITPHRHAYDDIIIYNFEDTTSYMLQGAPYHSEWMTFEWVDDGNSVNQIELIITDSLMSLLEKDYSMIEKYSDYYQ